MLIEAGKAYVTKAGREVGPVRPLTDEELATYPAHDLCGRRAVFCIDGVGVFDRGGEFISGQIDDSRHLAAEVGFAPLAEAPRGWSQFSVAAWANKGLIVANVAKHESEIIVTEAWFEPQSEAGVKLRLDNDALDSFGVAADGSERSLRSILHERARQTPTLARTEAA